MTGSSSTVDTKGSEASPTGHPQRDDPATGSTPEQAVGSLEQAPSSPEAAGLEGEGSESSSRGSSSLEAAGSAASEGERADTSSEEVSSSESVTSESDGDGSSSRAAGVAESRPVDAGQTESSSKETRTTDGRPSGEASSSTGGSEEVSGGRWGRVRAVLSRLGLTGRDVRVVLGWTAAGVLVVFWLLSVIWSGAPAPFVPDDAALRIARERGHAAGAVEKAGYVTTATLIRVARTLLTKGGGYLRNDIAPPGVLMDDMPSWETGVLNQVRVLVRTMQDVMTRGSSQGQVDPDLAAAAKAFETDADSWMFPSAERAYRDGISSLERYLDRLADEDPANAAFVVQGDVLGLWLDRMDQTLETLTQRLSASVGRNRVRRDGDTQADAQGDASGLEFVKTPWLRIDDVFYEARGAAWALVHLLDAAGTDFQRTLDRHGGTALLRQVVRDLQDTQKRVWSPMVMNGSEFGLFANHSLVMAAHLSSARAGLTKLRQTLTRPSTR